jgi:hypothetical protein
MSIFTHGSKSKALQAHPVSKSQQKTESKGFLKKLESKEKAKNKPYTDKFGTYEQRSNDYAEWRKSKGI